MKKILSVVAILLVLLTVLAVPVSASSAYQTYTYSIGGEALYSPDAYSAYKYVGMKDMGLDIDLSDPSDLVTDDEQNVYIADTGNNRIVMLDRYYRNPRYISTFINEQGIDDSLEKPKGVYVTKDRIWVCDTHKARIVVFDRDGNFIKTIPEPESEMFEENAIYMPSAIAVDKFNRLYVISETTYQGVIVLTEEGEFVKFIGAQKVTISFWQILWRKFQTEEQRKQTLTYVPTEFNNITITTDEENEGFIYVTTNSIDDATIESAIRGKSKAGDYMPVKMLNAAGSEIMRRNGFWPPAGEIDYDNRSKAGTEGGVSAIIDVACGPERTWSIIDRKRSKIYTYDFNGNLLFAFGDKGTMLGSVANISAITYQGDTMLVLDKANGSTGIIVYNRTPYGNMLLSAIAAENSLDYNYAIECWRAVLQHNANFDAAYVGIGNALYRSGSYKPSLEYFETAYDTANWSNSYKEVRKEWMSSNLIWLLLIIVAVIILVVKFFGYAAKVNKKGATDGRARKTFKQELLYGFYTIFHPFDGFWDLKHEKRGSVRAALIFILLTIVAFFYQDIGRGYVLNPTGSYSTIWVQAIGVLLPLFLFVLANWCLTTLFEGEGSFKDVFVAVSYCLLPVPMLVIPATFCSNFVVDSEANLISFVSTIAFVWLGILVFFATMVTHDYSLGGNVLAILGTVLGMALIMFVSILFTTLVAKIVTLITNIVTELEYRV